MKRSLFILFVLTRISSSSASEPTVAASCSQVEPKFVKELNAHKQPVCVCSESGLFSVVPGLAIECESISPSTLSANLVSMGSVDMGSLTIRDSDLNADSSSHDVFRDVKVSPAALQMDRCNYTGLSAETFAQMGRNMKVLSMRDNLITEVPADAFRSMKALKRLDLGRNAITTIEKDAFRGLAHVEDLVLNANPIETLTVGMFNGLTGLKKLNLAFCNIRSIEEGTFRGLDSLEMLILSGNQLESVEHGAFVGLNSLKVLEVGGNRMTSIEVKSLPKLEKIVMNNNDVDSMRAIKLRDLPSLSVVLLDRNKIQKLSDADLTGMVKSSRLETLSFAHNNISKIGVKAFHNVPALKTLLLQHNHIEELSGDTSKFSNATAPVLGAIKTLGTLQLSSNNLTVIRAGELPTSLVNLALDHNAISRIEPRALEGMVLLKRLYLQWNKLQFLYNGAFDSFSPADIEAIDVSSNSWQCVCKDPKEWLPGWLAEADEADVSEGPIGCLAIPNCGLGEDAPDFVAVTPDKKAPARWVTIVGTILFLFTVILMCVIGLLYFKDYRHQFTLRGRRCDSDLHKLIDNDPLNIPSDSILVIPALPKKPNPGGPKKTVRFQNFDEPPHHQLFSA